MKQYYPSIGIERFCRLFGKTRQAFYDHNRRDSDEQLHAALIIDYVRSIRASIPGIGGLKLHMMIKEKLQLHHITIGRDRFFDLLREHGLLIKRRKRFVQTTCSNHPYRKWTNLTIDKAVTATEQLWVSDITYLRIDNSFVYLSLITDVYSRKIVGYHLSQQLKAKGCIIALKKAIASLSSSLDNRQLIHHSDRGIQYCCEPYVTILKENNISISMTQTSSPYDNAIAERVNGILKHQLGLGKTFKNYNTAVEAVSKAVAAYNQLRPHMSISNLTPEKAHFTNQKISKTWKKRKSSVKLYQE